MDLLSSKKLLFLGTLIILAGVAGAGAVGLKTYAVTQKGQQFRPGSLTIHVGDTLGILNDDGELIHHAYVSSKSFSFDSGDQEPGTRADIQFTVPGTFQVLCGIHPKMRLDVIVQQ